MMLFPKIDTFASIARLTDNSHICLPSDERNQPFANDAVIISDEYPDRSFFCVSNFRRFLRSRLWLLCRLRRTRFWFLFRRHEFDSPLHGSSTVIFVPLPRELLIS